MPTTMVRKIEHSQKMDMVILTCMLIASWLQTELLQGGCNQMQAMHTPQTVWGAAVLRGYPSEPSQYLQ